MGKRSLLRMQIAAIQGVAQLNREVFAVEGFHQVGEMVRAAPRRTEKVRGKQVNIQYPFEQLDLT